MPLSASRRIHLDEVVSLLAPTLGQQKSESVVAEAARALGLHGRSWEPEAAASLLDHLGRAPGLVGNAARFARMRAPFSRAALSPDQADDAPPAGTSPEPSPAPAPPVPSIRATLVGLLASTLGEEKSEEAIGASMRKLGIAGASLERAQALRVLEDLALTPGLVGVTARFAKARLLLRS